MLSGARDDARNVLAEQQARGHQRLGRARRGHDVRALVSVAALDAGPRVAEASALDLRARQRHVRAEEVDELAGVGAGAAA